MIQKSTPHELKMSIIRGHTQRSTRKRILSGVRRYNGLVSKRETTLQIQSPDPPHSDWAEADPRPQPTFHIPQNY